MHNNNFNDQQAATNHLLVTKIASPLKTAATVGRGHRDIGAAREE